jgi:hypothetical protein
MSFDPRKYYIDWATSAFEKEVEEGFRRADTFDGMVSRQCVSAVKTLPPGQLKIVAHLLPRGYAAEDPATAAAKYNLQEGEQKALQSFMIARGELQRKMWPEMSERIGITSQREFQLQFRTARKECDAHVKDVGRAWNCRVLQAGAGEWCLVMEQTWGEARIAWKLLRNLELTYAIHLDSRQTEGVCAGHYLGALGIAPSNWLLKDASECKEVVTKARNFIWWHVEECNKIMSNCFAKRGALAADAIKGSGLEK